MSESCPEKRKRVGQLQYFNPYTAIKILSRATVTLMKTASMSKSFASVACTAFGTIIIDAPLLKEKQKEEVVWEVGHISKVVPMSTQHQPSLHPSVPQQNKLIETKIKILLKKKPSSQPPPSHKLKWPGRGIITIPNFSSIISGNSKITHP